MKAIPSDQSFSRSKPCPVIEAFVQEHAVLQQKLQELLQLAAPLQHPTAPTSYSDILHSLHSKARSFYTLFSLHAQKEEQFLLPILAKHLQNEAGPIAVMEFEHEQLHFHLATFLNHTKTMSPFIPRAEAKGLSYHLMEMAVILRGHFEKEEQIIYPLAEQLLSTGEKNLMLQQLQEVRKATSSLDGTNL